MLVHAVNISIEYTASNHWVSLVHGPVVQKPINVNPQLSMEAWKALMVSLGFPVIL